MKFRKITYRKKRDDEIDIIKVIERVLWQKDNKRVVEGIIISHKTKNIKSNYEYDTQKHLIGYHYFILQEKRGRRWHDIEGFQGNIKDIHYAYLIYNTFPIESIASVSYREGIKLFNERNDFNFSADKLLNEIKEKAKEFGIIEVRK